MGGDGEGSVRVLIGQEIEEGRVPPLSPTDFAGVVFGFSLLRIEHVLTCYSNTVIRLQQV